MAMSSVMPVPDAPSKPSALENAAKVLGIMSSLGGLGMQGYGAYSAATRSVPTFNYANPMGTPQMNVGGSNFGDLQVQPRVDPYYFQKQISSGGMP